MLRPSPRLLALLWLAACVGCNGRGTFYDQALVTEGPLAGSSRLVTLNGNAGALILIDPVSATAPTAVALPSSSRHLTLTPDGSTALVATGDAYTPGLTRVNLVPGPALGARTDIALPVATDVISVSPDGRYVLLTHGSTSSGTNVGVIDPNEAVVVNLANNKAVRTNLGTGSANPISVAFAVPYNGGDQLATVLFSGAVAVLDLANPAEVLRTPLQATGTTPLIPVKALFSTFVSSGLGYLYVQAQGDDDIVTLALKAATASQKLSATLNFLAGGTGLSDIGVPTGTAASHTVLALYSGSKQAYSLDAAGLVDATLITALSSAVTRLVFFSGTLEIAFTEGSGTSLFFWDTALGSATAVTLDGPLHALVVSPDGLHAAASVTSSSFPEMVILTALPTSAGPKVSVHPLQLGALAISPVFDASGQALYFGESNPHFLVRLDPASQAYLTLPLATAPASVGAGAQVVYASLTGAPYGSILTVPIQDYQAKREILFDNYVLTGEVTIVGQ